MAVHELQVVQAVDLAAASLEASVVVLWLLAVPEEDLSLQGGLGAVLALLAEALVDLADLLGAPQPLEVAGLLLRAEGQRLEHREDLLVEDLSLAVELGSLGQRSVEACIKSSRSSSLTSWRSSPDRWTSRWAGGPRTRSSWNTRWRTSDCFHRQLMRSAVSQNDFLSPPGGPRGGPPAIGIAPGGGPPAGGGLPPGGPFGTPGAPGGPRGGPPPAPGGPLGTPGVQRRVNRLTSAKELYLSPRYLHLEGQALLLVLSG